MKAYIFSVVIFLYLTFCNINISLTKLIVPEYHFNEDIHFTEHGCQISKNKNDNIKVKYTSFKKENKLNKRLNRTPLADPFIVKYEFNSASPYARKRLTNITNYAFEVFKKVFDFYQPLRIKITVDDKPENNFCAKTIPPVLYALRDPLENMTIAYPLPLAKQLNINGIIDFDANNEFDLQHIIDNDFLEERNKILDVVIIHEMLHGLGLTSQIRTVTNGEINKYLPPYHSESKYYMPDLLEHKNEAENVMTIETFVPLSVWEKNFVDYQNQNKYYFTEKFNSISGTPIFIDYHEPIYASEKSRMSNIQEAVDNWEGLQEGIYFYEKAHQGRTIGFKTKDGKVIPVLTYEDGSSSPDLHHVCSRDMIYMNPENSTGSIDQNFAMYPRVIMQKKLNQILTENNLGPNNKHGYLSDDLISILETMGYHRKGTPLDNKVYEVVNEHQINEDKPIVDGKDTKGGNNKENAKIAESSAKSLCYQSFTLIIFILFSFFLYV